MKKITLTLVLTALATLCAAQEGLMWNRSKAVRNDFVPLPQSVEYTPGEFVMCSGMSIEGGEPFNVRYLREHFSRVFDFDVPATRMGNIRLLRKSSLDEEEYELEVTPDGITIRSSAKAGEFHAIQTLLQMMPPEIYRRVSGPDGLMLKEYKLPCARICDRPRFSYRGSMLDVSRTFFDKEYVMRHIDWLAYHKINSFHWHLADDNGWRIEIKKYPLLTGKGAWRGADEVLPPSFNSGSGRYGGFYTQDDIREIVVYAADRNITIIPEIDLPGHSSSVAATYPEILCRSDGDFLSVQGEGKNVFCVGKESNYKMLDNIFKEIAALFPGQYIHIGGDEVQMQHWKNCPDCQALMKKEGMKDEGELLTYFVTRLEKILAKYGKKLAGWDEISSNGGLDKTSCVYAWRSNASAMKAIDQGMNVVLQIGAYCYLDMKYTPDERGHNWAGLVPMEKIYSFDPTGTLDLTEEQKKLVRGPQAGLWTELLIFPPHFSEYQMFPRLCALAEIGWSDQEQRDYADFDRRLCNSHFARMYNMNIRFRIPYPKVDASTCGEFTTVTATSPYPSMVVRYTTDGTDPVAGSPVASGPIITQSPESLRFATFYNDLRSISARVPDSERFLTPEVKVTTDITPNRNTPVSVLEDYDRNTYFRPANAPEVGNWILFEFTEPVECNSIEVLSNIPKTQFWGITEGHVEYSLDGVSFVRAADFDRHNSVLMKDFEAPVKAVKVVVDGKGEKKAISLQDLKIK